VTSAPRYYNAAKAKGRVVESSAGMIILGRKDAEGPDYPRLRRVEAFVTEVEGEEMVCLSDPEGIARDVVALSPPAFLAASLLDGKNSPAAVRAACAKAFGGHEITGAELAGLVERLDSSFLLDSSSFRLERARVLGAWMDNPVRSATSAGASYPGEPGELGEWLKGFFSAEGGPGWLENANPARPPARGLIAPHIDFARGGPVYAWAHRRILESPLPPLVVVLGVAHAPSTEPFALTTKDFDTPCGTVENDREAAGQLAEACGWITGDEPLHRMEHSVEFQAVWLKALNPGREFRILPILCGDFSRYAKDGSPMNEPRIAGAVEALARLVRERKVLVLASVDLAHVGPDFGDEKPVDEEVSRRVGTRDGEILEAAASGDPDLLWTEGMKDGNINKVDALSAAWTLSAVLRKAGVAATGTVLAYGQAPAPGGGMVSFGAVSYENQAP